MRTTPGELALECRKPTKKLSLTLSAFAGSGQAVNIADDTVAVRVRSAAPVNLTVLFSGLESQTKLMAAAFASQLSSTPISTPADNVVRVDFGALLSALKTRQQELHDAPAKNAALGAGEPMANTSSAEFTQFVAYHFGEVGSYRNGVDLFRGMGPEMAFQYHAAGKTNTLVVHLADVVDVLTVCSE